jgi:hypothetical protein
VAKLILHVHPPFHPSWRGDKLSTGVTLPLITYRCLNSIFNTEYYHYKVFLVHATKAYRGIQVFAFYCVMQTINYLFHSLALLFL